MKNTNNAFIAEVAAVASPLHTDDAQLDCRRLHRPKPMQCSLYQYTHRHTHKQRSHSQWFSIGSFFHAREHISVYTYYTINISFISV